MCALLNDTMVMVIHQYIICVKLHAPSVSKGQGQVSESTTLMLSGWLRA